MPAATAIQAIKSEREERLLDALKSNILKERQRKKEEHEAEVEEERLRKEREAREKQDEMTLGETREQIQKLDQKLKELRNQKQQLFLQLKKVLNEDENRKKQQQQKDSEIFAMHSMPPQAAPHGQIFLPPRQTPQQILQKGGVMNIGNVPMKRGRSPSPPSPQGYYKNPAYSASPKHDDARRGDVARVLWNKPAAYQNPPGTLFYQTTSAAPVQPDSRTQSIMYPSYNLNLNMHSRQNYHIEMPQPPQPQVHPQKNDKTVYINIDVPMPMPHQNAAAGHAVKPPTHVAMEIKQEPSQQQVPHLPEGVAYTSLMPGIPMHPTVMQMPSNQSQGGKPTGNAGQGYPNRGSRVDHNQPQMPEQPPPQSQQILYPRRLF